MRTPIIAGNWKMHKTGREALALIEALNATFASRKPQADVVVCPPFTALGAVCDALDGGVMRLGAQNMDWRAQGAFTGEVSAVMLREFGVGYVIVGHSERRQLFKESDEAVNQKVKAALAAELVPIVCVGETLDEREAGTTDGVVAAQLRAGLDGVAAEAIARIVIAYEPVWAIGTGRTCDAEEANRVCAWLRQVVGALAGLDAAQAVRVLYGGSVKPETIASQMAQSDIDGALVGGASLEAEAFAAIACFSDHTVIH
jgi:triosephosphate isomerase